jgi:hypothetical protein
VIGSIPIVQVGRWHGHSRRLGTTMDISIISEVGVPKLRLNHLVAFFFLDTASLRGFTVGSTNDKRFSDIVNYEVDDESILIKHFFSSTPTLAEPEASVIPSPSPTQPSSRPPFSNPSPPFLCNYSEPLPSLSNPPLTHPPLSPFPLPYPLFTPMLISTILLRNRHSHTHSTPPIHLQPPLRLRLMSHIPSIFHYVWRGWRYARWP